MGEGDLISCFAELLQPPPPPPPKTEEVEVPKPEPVAEVPEESGMTEEEERELAELMDED